MKSVIQWRLVVLLWILLSFCNGQVDGLPCSPANKTVLTSARYDVNSPPGCDAQCRPKDSRLSTDVCKAAGGKCLQRVGAEDMLHIYDTCLSEVSSRFQCPGIQGDIVASFKCLDEFTYDPCDYAWTKGLHEVSLLRIWKLSDLNRLCKCDVKSDGQQAFNISYLNFAGSTANTGQPKLTLTSSGIRTHLPHDDIFLYFNQILGNFTISFEPSDPLASARQILAIHAPRPFDVVCSSVGITPLRSTTAKSPRPGATTETTQISSARTTKVTTFRHSTTSATSMSPTETTSETKEEPSSGEDAGHTRIIIGVVCGVGGLAVVCAVIVTVVCFRRRRGPIYDDLLPRRQREITVYTSLIPETLRERHLESVAALSHLCNDVQNLYSDAQVDERRVDPVPGGPSQPNDYLQPTARPTTARGNRSKRPRRPFSRSVHGIRTDEDGYLCPCPRVQK